MEKEKVNFPSSEKSKGKLERESEKSHLESLNLATPLDVKYLAESIGGAAIAQSEKIKRIAEEKGKISVEDRRILEELRGGEIFSVSGLKLEIEKIISKKNLNEQEVQHFSLIREYLNLIYALTHLIIRGEEIPSDFQKKKEILEEELKNIKT